MSIAPKVYIVLPEGIRLVKVIRRPGTNYPFFDVRARVDGEYKIFKVLNKRHLHRSLKAAVEAQHQLQAVAS